MITYPLNNIDYTAEDAELFHCTRTSGIWAKDSFPISVTGADNNVTIGTGIAWINNEEFSGKVTALKSAEVLDLGIADSTYPRIDVIAIQFNANNNATDVIVKKGTPASNPVRPAIVRNGAVYELYIASVYRPAGATVITASNVTDLRMDETVCGLMADSVTKVDMAAIEAQVRSLINNLQNEIDSVRNLSGIMFESEWVDGDVIPVSKGGTGADNAEQGLKNLGVALHTVQRYKDGNWTVTKYSDGTVEAEIDGGTTSKFITQITGMINNYGLFEGDSIAINLPSGLFKTVELPLISCRTSNGCLAYNPNATTSAVWFYPVNCVKQTDPINVGYHIIVNGTY